MYTIALLGLPVLFLLFIIYYGGPVLGDLIVKPLTKLNGEDLSREQLSTLGSLLGTILFFIAYLMVGKEFGHWLRTLFS